MATHILANFSKKEAVRLGSHSGPSPKILVLGIVLQTRGMGWDWEKDEILEWDSDHCKFPLVTNEKAEFLLDSYMNDGWRMFSCYDSHILHAQKALETKEHLPQKYL